MYQYNRTMEDLKINYSPIKGLSDACERESQQTTKTKYNK